MKRLSFLPLLVLLPFLVGGQTVRQVGLDFIDAFFEKRYADALGYFDERMQAQVSESQLKEIGKALSAQIGNYKRNIEINEESKDGVTTLYYYSEFELQRLDIQLAFNDRKQIAGFYFVPHRQFDSDNASEETRLGVEYKINSGDIDLPGTLILSEKPILVIFVHGSGPTDRDASVHENKPFKEIAEGLARNGISSYRFDKRTKVAPELFIDKAFTIDDEVTDDVVNIVRHFRKSDSFKNYQIFLLGHSFGGMMMPRIVHSLADQVEGAILFAANARPLGDMLLEQYHYLYELQPSKAMKEAMDKLEKQVRYLKGNKFNLQSPAEKLPLGLPASYWNSLKDYDQLSAFQKVGQPFLILQGENDYQVSMVDFELWKAAAKGKTNVSFIAYPKVNHIFMESDQKPQPSDYLKKAQVPAYIINDIANWIIGAD